MTSWFFQVGQVGAVPCIMLSADFVLKSCYIALFMSPLPCPQSDPQTGKK